LSEIFSVREITALQRRRRLARLQEKANHDAGAPVETSSPLDRLLEHLFGIGRGRPDRQLVIEVSGEAHPRRIALNRALLLIGRDPHCDVRIEHSGVAPFQAYVQWLDGGLFFHDLSNSVPPNRVSAWVGPKPLVSGPLRLSFAVGESCDVPSFDPLAPHPELAAEVPQVQLQFARVDQRDNLWPVDRRLTLIGRGEQCKLRLDHPDVPLVLASLIRTPSSCWLIKLCGEATLRVNGKRVRAASLDIGDTLQLGPFTAEVTTAPFSLKDSRTASQVETEAITVAARELAASHRSQLVDLQKSFKELREILDSNELNSMPGLKTALQQYVNQSHRLHRETQAELERLATQETSHHSTE
jgi:hypothetical protein